MSIRFKEIDKRKLLVITYALSLVLFGIIVDSPGRILGGLFNIITRPDPLITDYMHETMGGIGATLVNSGLLTLLLIIMLMFFKVDFNGATIAALFTVSGFAFFGKNIFNIWSIVLGVFLYAKVRRDHFSKYIYIALFGTAMSPIASEITFNFDLPFGLSFLIGAIVGILIGFILPPVANHLIKTHQGYNLYNVGFTAGIIGTVFVSIIRSFGYTSKAGNLWSTGNNFLFSSYLYSIFIIMLISGYFLNDKSFKNLFKLMKHSGRLVTDFINLEGFGITLFNMGLLGIISTTYILLIKGDLNGPTIGGILTIVGFGAFGKHPRNILPILIGVYLASLIKNWDATDPNIQLAALFGTALAPIAGEFGCLIGIIAAIIHSSVVLNIGYLHGGLNLYNNGFSAGIIAMLLVPIIQNFRKSHHEIALYHLNE